MFNLNTKKWTNLLSLDNDDNKGVIPYDIKRAYGHFIASPIDQLHLFDKNSHFKYEDVEKVAKLSGNVGRYFLTRAAFYTPMRNIYCKQLQLLMVFETYSRNILVCNIKDKNQTIFNWVKHKIQSPATSRWDIILGFDQLVFFFQHQGVYIGPKKDEDEEFKVDDDANWEESVSIWCLDLLNNGEWYESKEKLPAAMYSGWWQTPNAIKILPSSPRLSSHHITWPEHIAKYPN